MTLKKGASETDGDTPYVFDSNDAKRLHGAGLQVATSILEYILNKDGKLDLKQLNKLPVSLVNTSLSRSLPESMMSRHAQVAAAPEKIEVTLRAPALQNGNSYTESVS